jgi:two-component system nitrogen regulation sensor histidine kinase GlnL
VTCTRLPEEADALLMTFYDWSAALALDRQVKLRSAARSVAGMAAMLAHEVKNPLSGIRGAAQLLEQASGEDDRQLAILIREETDRIRALLDRMEAFGDPPLERSAVNIHRVLDHVRRLAGTGFAAHLTISQQYDPSLPPVRGNRDQLVQVFLNLVKNAAEAITEAGQGGEISLITAYQPGVRLTRDDAGVKLPLLVAVRDDGPGIAEAVQRTLFEPFVTTKAGGSGLGLALIAKIIGDHGGVVEVESRPGRSEFRVYLPVFPENP